MVEKLYENIRGSGENLYKAILDSAYSSGYNPRLIDDWIDDQAKSYLDEDWDNDYIEKLLDDYENSEILLIFEMLKEHDIDIDNICISDINRNHFLKWSEEYQDIKKDLCKKVYEDLELSSQHGTTRYDNAYERASEDYDIFIEDIDTEDDEQVREFFNIEAKLYGYKIDNDEYDLQDLFICPNCDRPNTKNDIKQNFEEEQEEEYDSRYFYCHECEWVELFTDQSFVKTNSHITEEEIISRSI